MLIDNKSLILKKNEMLRHFNNSIKHTIESNDMVMDDIDMTSVEIPSPSSCSTSASNVFYDTTDNQFKCRIRLAYAATFNDLEYTISIQDNRILSQACCDKLIDVFVPMCPSIIACVNSNLRPAIVIAAEAIDVEMYICDSDSLPYFMMYIKYRTDKDSTVVVASYDPFLNGTNSLDYLEDVIDVDKLLCSRS